MSNIKTGEELKKELMLETKNLGATLSDEELDEVFAFNEGYKTYLDKCKTEREAVSTSIKMAQDKGYVEFDANTKYVAGDKVYYNNRNKALVLAHVGEDAIENGVNINIAHIDSPRLDLKPRPLYEEAQLGLFKTHYYGGIKKYQWTTIPLSLHGVLVKGNGETVEVNIGEDETDPVFCVTDLLPHLATDQMKRSAPEIILGEELNVLIGSLSFKDDNISEKVKLNILKILNEKYGIIEKDFITAELELVPAFKAKDIGFDRSMVGAYGQDDRVCAYTALMAQFGLEKAPQRTLVTVLADKEEIGSVGNTGLNSDFVKFFIGDLAAPHGVADRTVLSKSKCLSADVNAGFDPTFPSVHEKNNAAFLNYGVVLTKYTGARGKSSTSDASAEFVAKVAKVFDDSNVGWQVGELGKVDAGGGGTVAAYVAKFNIDVVDVGVPLLSMHAPLEIASKIDVYMTYKAFKAFGDSVII